MRAVGIPPKSFVEREFHDFSHDALVALKIQGLSNLI